MEYSEKRRKHSRVDATIKVKYKSVKDFLIEYSRNLSKGGIFLVTPEPLPEGTKVRLLFYLPNSSKELKVLGEVIHIMTGEDGRQRGQEPGMGIKFIVSPNSKREINEYIDRLLAEKDIIIEGRRQHPRFVARIKIGFRSINAFLWVYSKDISKGGIFISTTNLLPLHSKVQLKLCLPGRSKETSVFGEVVYIAKEGEAKRGPGMGLQFIDFDKEGKKEIEEYLEKVEHKRY